MRDASQQETPWYDVLVLTSGNYIMLQASPPDAQNFILPTYCILPTNFVTVRILSEKYPVFEPGIILICRSSFMPIERVKRFSPIPLPLNPQK